MRLVVGRLAAGTWLSVAGCYSGIDGSAGADGMTDGATGASASGGPGSEGSSGGPSGETDDVDDGEIHAGRAPLRRLTRFEYDNTVRDLLGDQTMPAAALPSEQIGNGFGNDADAQSVSSLLAEQYANVAEDVADRATETPAKLAALTPCAGENLDADAEDGCAFELIETFVAKAYRRPLQAGEADDLFELQQKIRETSSFAQSIASVLEAVLQSPDFLYRLEFGELDEQGRLRPTSHEMATRLSYFFWGSMPDDVLFAAADAGELRSKSEIRAQAERMLEDPRARLVTRFFFDNLLPISGLSGLQRNPALYPEYSSSIGSLMREETQAFLEHEIFEGPGTWAHALTADYTYLNGALADYYGLEGVSGDDFVRVDLDPNQRMGILTHAGVLSGTIHSNETNPVTRGSFLVRRMLCLEIPLPTGDVLDEVKPPDPESGATARERYAAHSDDPRCASCHVLMDPVGFTFENYDAVGRWRDTENGVTIDPSGALPTSGEQVAGPLELIAALANEPKAHDCFARHWANFAYGRTLDDDDAAVTDALENAFSASGSDIRGLLVDLTQTDAFLFLPQPGRSGGGR